MQDIFTRQLNFEYCEQLVTQLTECGAKRQDIGQSVRGRALSALWLGRGRKKILYLASTHAAETIVGSVLIKFVYDLLTVPMLDGISTSRVLSQAQLCIIPLFNPDGAEIAQGRIDEQDLARLQFYNDGSGDFSRWQANDRGVDLNHNFDADFEQGVAFEKAMNIYGPSRSRHGGRCAFSEPETSALRDLVEKEDFDCFYSFHTQGEEIYSAGKGALPMAMVLAKSCGYRVSNPEGIASVRGAKDWFCQKYNRPGFTVEMGRGENPLPMSQASSIYRKCREMLMLTTIIS